MFTCDFSLDHINFSTFNVHVHNHCITITIRQSRDSDRIQLSLSCTCFPVYLVYFCGAHITMYRICCECVWFRHRKRNRQMSWNLWWKGRMKKLHNSRVIWNSWKRKLYSSQSKCILSIFKFSHCVCEEHILETVISALFSEFLSLNDVHHDAYHAVMNIWWFIWNVVHGIWQSKFFYENWFTCLKLL